MPLTVGKTHRLPPEQLHFTQGIPAPLPRRDPRTCWKTTQDRPVPRVAIYTGLAVFRTGKWWWNAQAAVG